MVLRRPRGGKKGGGDDKAGGDEKASKPDRELRFSPSLADAGHEGYMIRSPYAEVAHFLVVRRMLERFKKVFFYMDASYDLTQPVMVALHDWVESGRAHVAVFQHEKTGKREQEKDRAPRGTREEALPKAIAQAETRFARCVEEKLEVAAKTEDLLGDDTRVRRARAAAWQLAPQGAQSKDGAFAWLHFSGNTSHYRNCRTLWLSRGPDDAPDDGCDLLIGVTLQSVDSACNAMRSRVNTIGRSAGGAKGMNHARLPHRVEQVMGELRTYLLMRNFGRRPGRAYAHETIPAATLGLSDGEEVDMVDVLWTFRLGIEHAREVSQWLSQ